MSMSDIERLMQSDDPSDTFKFDVVKALSESLRLTVSAVNDMRKDIAEDRKVMYDIRERLVRIESNKVNESVASLTTKVDSIAAKVDKLEAVNDRRDGATGLLTWIFKNWPGIIGMIATIVVVLTATGKL